MHKISVLRFNWAIKQPISVSGEDKNRRRAWRATVPCPMAMHSDWYWQRVEGGGSETGLVYINTQVVSIQLLSRDEGEAVASARCI